MAQTTTTQTEPVLVLPESEEQRCRAYGRAKLALNLAELLVILGVLVALTATGASRSLLGSAQIEGLPIWGRHLLFLVEVGFLCRLALLPVQYLNEHWLDRRFGLSHQSFRSWFWEWLCRSAIFGGATVVCLFPVAETLRWWPLLALPWCLLFLLLKRFFYDYVYYPVLAAFYPVRFLRHETFSLPGLGKRTLPVYEVKVSHKTVRANAAIRLRGKQTAIYVTDTLIEEFTDGEERVVMAHEFGHLYDRLHLEERTRAGVAQAHRKLLWGSTQLVAGAAALLSIHLASPWLGLAGVQDLAGFPLLAALALLFTQLLAPILCAEARQDERDADQYALAITDDPENYLSVMRKLRRMNLEESEPGPLNRLLFNTHPSYSERAHLALAYRRRKQPRKVAAWRGWRHIQRHGRR
jgi:STE24 endopeptidase